jgi:ABC-type amino acid transport substrate-binding protein
MRSLCALLLSLVLGSLLGAAPGFAADLPEIKARGQLVAATSGNLPPVTYLNDKNELIGYDIEVGRFIAKHLGVKLDLVRLDWKGILPGLQTGRFDLVLSNVNITPERKQTFDYSIPYSRSAVVVVSRANVADINGPTDLKGRLVGAISGGMDGEIPARAIEKEHGVFKGFKGYAGYAEMFADMEIGRIEAAVAPDTAAANFIKDKPGVAKIVGKPYVVRYVGVPMQKPSPQLKEKVDEAIRTMRKDGLLDRWAKQYFGIDNFSAQLIDRVP